MACGSLGDYHGTINSWAKAGCDGWSFDDIAPDMMKSETYEAGSEGRGKTGPLIISDFVKHHPLTEDFIRAGRELQLPVLKDYNRDTREGVGLVQQTRTGRFRVSTATAYLRPAMSRRNLTVVCHAHACQITVRNRVATGVTYRRHGETKTARARHEVILSAGAIGSPHLLQLSGIGKSDDLQALGIPVIHDLPGVGYNLQDHYLARVGYEVSGQLTLNELSCGWRLWREIARYIFKGEGILTYSAGNGTGFFRSHPALPQPDLQFNFTPASYSSTRIGKLETVPAVSCSVWQMRPESRGRISAKSTDPFAAPDISPAYLTAEIDRKTIVEGLRMCRRVMNSSAFAANRKAERLPGAAVESYDDWLDFARRTGSTVYHPVGTCRMGAGEDAVVAPDLKVRNIERLRVIDASIMPSITSSNTHAPTVMIAEKGAAMVLADLRRKRTP